VKHQNQNIFSRYNEIFSSSKNISFIHGLKAGLPIALGYIPIAIAFGVLSKSLNIPSYISILMSFIIFAGASQFVGVNLISIGASMGEIILTTFILNFRHFLMSSSLSQRIKGNTPKSILGILAFGITDETFAIASLQKDEKLSPGFILGLNIIAFTSWNIGTWLGILISSGLPEFLKNGMGIALYAMFIGLLTPSLRKSRSVLTVASVAAIVNSFLHWTALLTAGWNIIISTIIASAIGSFLFRREEI